jgi:hypothetical protein
MTVPDRL